jgi:Peptidase family M23
MPRILILLAAIIALATPVTRASEPEQMTPILLSVQNAPIPFTGSDARTHLVYELWLTNFSSADATIERVQILGDNGAILQDLGPAEIAARLQLAGTRTSTATLAKSTQALLFLHITLAPGAKPPAQLTHRVTTHIAAAPPGQQEITSTGAPTQPNLTPPVRIGPPLQGSLFLSADSCCDAVRHTRASLPVNGHVWIAQRFAVDWEQLDSSGRIYSGPREKLESYPIFGKPAIAVADAIVVSTTDRYPEQVPGKFPTNILVEQADGNSVVLDLGGHRYALYAHLQPGSIKVHPGDRVKLGQVLALVGDTGNSIVPHLHFHVMDSPSPLTSNGLPYEIDNFQITARSPGTEPFDAAESNGTPLATTPVTPAQPIQNALPLDQLVISFNP